jgi:glutaminyl-peptide cyclotransferase
VIIRRNSDQFVAFLLMMLLLLLSACNTTEITQTPVVVKTIKAEVTKKTLQPSATETTQVTKAIIHEEVIEETREATTPTENKIEPLPPEPIEGSFQTSDGIALSSTFYPAKTVDAPLIVLFHWARGDQAEWAAIAPWLQNRDFQPNLVPNGSPWLDPSWFPTIPEEESFNVFTFTFRGCEGGCQVFNREGWLLDIEAAMAFVADLENVDLSRVATMGASIGADGAAYGCYVYNRDYGGCQGALSLSPGGYLTFTYAQEVAYLASETPPTPAWCLYSVGDSASARACEAASGEGYRTIAYADNAHGFAMLEPNREPNPLDLTLDFLNETGLCPSCKAVISETPMTYEVINVFPHDPQAFTQGLIYLDGFLYESTGLYGQSSLRKVELETGEVLQQVDLSSEYFAEGLTAWEDTLIQLTWRKGTGFVYTKQDFSLVNQFTYPTEGWGLTHDGERLIMSDGSSRLHFLDPETFQVISSSKVTYQGKEIQLLNELEYIKGEVFANIYRTDQIARIDPDTGDVLGWIDLSSLLPESERTSETGVLNGIAYDEVKGRLFVTGKNWPKLFEIRLVPAP